MITYADLEQEIDRGTRPELVRGFVVATLTEIAEDRRQLRAVRHPLGFICLPVIRSGEDGVCVHAWPGDRATTLPPTTSGMHSHSWDLLSHVLHGRVHNQIIEVTDTVTDPAFRVYEVHSHGDVDEIRATPQLVGARSHLMQTRRAGESYRLRAGRFHITEVDSAHSTVTVALGRNVPGTADLSLGAVGGRNHQVRRRLCDLAETVAMARWIVQLISHGEGSAADGGSGDI
jgi:hypothetical protein